VASSVYVPDWCSTDRLVYAFHLDAPTPSNNVIKQAHFHVYKRVRETWRARVIDAIGHRLLSAPIDRSALVIVRFSAGALDWDNALGGLKPLFDCLVAPSDRNPSGLGLIRDDNPRNMPFPPFMQQLSAKRGAGSTSLYIYALP
jgi:hypothetical protein